MKFFNCGRIGHFSNKCPYPKQEDSDDEEPCCHNKDPKSKTMYKKKFKKNKKKLYFKEYIEDEQISEDFEVLFMVLENKIYEEEIEGLVDIELELVSALEELGKYKMMYKKLKNSYDRI